MVTKVTLLAPAKVGGKRHPQGAAIPVSEISDIEISHLVQAGALPKSVLEAISAAGGEDLQLLLDKAEEEISSLRSQLATQRETFANELAGVQEAARTSVVEAQSAAAAQIKASEKEAADHLAAYQTEAEGKITALATELAALKADGKPGKKS